MSLLCPLFDLIPKIFGGPGLCCCCESKTEKFANHRLCFTMRHQILLKWLCGSLFHMNSWLNSKQTHIYIRIQRPCVGQQTRELDIHCFPLKIGFTVCLCIYFLWQLFLQLFILLTMIIRHVNVLYFPIQMYFWWLIKLKLSMNFVCFHSFGHLCSSHYTCMEMLPSPEKANDCRS